MNIVYLGTPQFAVPPLERILKKHNILAVVTQPDKPANRGRITMSPVKECALKHEIKVLQYNSIKRQGVDELKSLNPDIMITAAYGQILSKQILEIAPKGVINIHASLLPKYRGPAPMQWALVNGETTTGVTIMQTDVGIDTGDIISQQSLEIPKYCNAEQLFAMLSDLGAEMLEKCIDGIEKGTANFTKQNNDDATYFPMVKKEDGLIDFGVAADSIVNKINGLYIWPNAYTSLNGKMLKIFSANVLQTNQGETGTVIASDRKNGLVVKCGKDAVAINELQLEGGKRMDVKSFLNGKSVPVGTRLGG